MTRNIGGIGLVSPDYSFEDFCLQMLGKDLLVVMDAAGAEISCARVHHRMTTEAKDFRKGSKGRAYCENLQRLVTLLMNGSIPGDATPNFLFAAKPLVAELLQSSEIGKLRRFLRFFPNTPQGELGWLPQLSDLGVVVSRSDVEAADILPYLGVLNGLPRRPKQPELSSNALTSRSTATITSRKSCLRFLKCATSYTNSMTSFRSGSFSCQSTISGFSAYSTAFCPHS